jgi:hypothetical protein
VRELEDILLSERDSGDRSKGIGRASYSIQVRGGKGREMAYKKVQVSAKMSRNRAPQ